MTPMFESGSFTTDGPLVETGTFEMSRTPVEKLEAAISVLLEIRDEWWTRNGPCLYLESSDPGDVAERIACFDHEDQAFAAETLHRTIDAQLKVLRNAIAHQEAWRAAALLVNEANPGPDSVDGTAMNSTVVVAVALAEAILGGERS